MNEINRSPDLEMVVLKEISSAIVNERNGTALLRHILDVLYRRMKCCAARSPSAAGTI